MSELFKIAVSIPLGLLYGNFAEWFIHRYILHGLGKNKNSFWRTHWYDHHRNSRRAGNFDVDYTKPLFRWHAAGKELGALVGLAISHLPLFFVAPYFAATLFYCACNYYFKHKKSHLDVEWGRKKVPWHLDHHLGPNQDANWCVTKPWFDHILGTREPYIGTERERADLARKNAKQQRDEAPIAAT